MNDGKEVREESPEQREPGAKSALPDSLNLQNFEFSELIDFVDALFAKYGFTPRPQMVGRQVVGVMHHHRSPCRIERDEKGNYFGVCVRCGYSTDAVTTFDAAYKLVTTGHRGHCSANQNNIGDNKP
jgi:hypothetical protein